MARLCREGPRSYPGRPAGQAAGEIHGPWERTVRRGHRRNKGPGVPSHAGAAGRAKEIGEPEESEGDRPQRRSGRLDR